MSPQKSFLKFWSLERSKSVPNFLALAAKSQLPPKDEASGRKPAPTTPNEAARESKNQQRRAYLLRELNESHWRNTSALVSSLEEIQLHQLSPLQNCEAVAAILQILQRTRLSKQLALTAVGALKGFLQDQCEGEECSPEEESSYIHFGASHECLSRVLQSILLDDKMDCGSGRLQLATLTCLVYLVTHGNGAGYIETGPVLICMAGYQGDSYVTTVATTLLKELLIHGADPEKAIPEGAIELLCRIFSATERRKTTVLLETLVLLVTAHPLGRALLHQTTRLPNNLARLLSLLSFSSEHVTVSSSLRLIAVIIQGRADLKQVVMKSKHLPSLGRLLEQDSSSLHLDDTLRVISYLVHGNEVSATPLVPFVPTLLRIVAKDTDIHGGRVAACSVLTELCMYSHLARTAILHHVNGLSSLLSILPGEEGKVLHSVLSDNLNHVETAQEDVPRM